MVFRVTICLFVVACLVQRAAASDTLVIKKMSDLDSIPLLKHASFFEHRSGDMAWQDVARQSFKPAPKSWFSYFYDSAYKRHITVWFRLTIQNAMNDSVRISLSTQQYSFYRQIVMLSPGDTVIKRPNYFFTTSKKNARTNVIASVAPHSYITYLICQHNPYERLGPMEIRSVQAYEDWEVRWYAKRSANYLTEFIFLAVIGFITLHTLVQYFMRRRKEFIWYALYTTSVFFLFVHSIELLSYYDIFFSYFPYLQIHVSNPLFMLVGFCYLRFARAYVDFKSIAPWYYQVVIWTERLILATIVAHFTLDAAYGNYETAVKLFFWLRIWLFAVAFTGVFLLLRMRKKVLNFFAVGSLCLALGLTLSMVFWYLRDIDPLGKQNNGWYMQIGMLLELLCFTSGLSYKSRLIEKDKHHMQQQLISQLIKNRGLQEELGQLLHARAKGQTGQILSQQRELEKEKEKQLTLEFTKKIAEMELQLLKSQLNPHFYFNTLNNLYGLAMIAPKKAPDAILKLSDIMEYVIYDCRNDKVSLGKELKFLQSYVELEKLRYDENARISLQVTGRADNKFISPMLLIQFVENAFKHGMEKEKEKSNSFLQININVLNGSLEYESTNSINGHTAKNGGIGLTNVRKRLDMLYPQKHDLQVIPGDHEYRVKLKLTLS
jgi:hypothetical protein